jgi:S-adenosylmethionine hydrolase
MGNTRIITLITDFGEASGYIGIMKGVILSINPECRIIDITHHISPQDREEAAFVLKSTCPFFPPDTIHLVVVDPGVGSTRKPIIVESSQSWFVGPDNGVFSFIFLEGLQKRVWEITNDRYFLSPVSPTFHGRDIFAPIAAHLSSGVCIHEIGKELKDCVQLEELEPEVHPDMLKGRVVLIDHFGNLVSNISHKLFTRVVGTNPFQITVGNRVIRKIYNTYSDAEDGEVVALFGSFQHLEISVRNGNCQRLLRVSKGFQVSVHVLS